MTNVHNRQLKIHLLNLAVILTLFTFIGSYIKNKKNKRELKVNYSLNVWLEKSQLSCTYHVIVLNFYSVLLACLFYEEKGWGIIIIVASALSAAAFACCILFACVGVVSMKNLQVVTDNHWQLFSWLYWSSYMICF